MNYIDKTIFMICIHPISLNNNLFIFLIIDKLNLGINPKYYCKNLGKGYIIFICFKIKKQFLIA